MTSNGMVGADADELDRIAQDIRTSADELERGGSQLTTTVRQMPWYGGDASQFSGEWTKKHLPRITESTTFLRDIATHVVQQASEQRQASSGATGAISSQLTPEQVQQLNRLDDVAREKTRSSPDEQLAWWNSLSPEEQALLLDERPALLMKMDGLPADVLERAHDEYLIDAAADVVVSTSTYEMGVSVPIPGTPVGVGLQMSAETTVYADGSADVTIAGGPEVGGGAGVVSAEGGPTNTVTYHFDSAAEAEEFLKGLRNTLLPTSYLPWIGGPTPAEFLEEHGSHLVRPDAVGVGLQGSAAVSAVIGTAELDASVTVEHNRDSSYTLTAYGQISGDILIDGAALAMATDAMHADSTGVGGSISYGEQPFGAASGSASLNIDSNGQPQSLVVSYDINTGHSNGLHGDIEASHSTSTGATTTLEFDLTDPVVAAKVKPIVESIARGDAQGVVQQLDSVTERNELLDNATVTHTTSTREGYNGGFDFDVVSAGGSYETTTTTSATVKPPGGTPEQIVGTPP